MNSSLLNLNKWFVCPQASPAAETRLFLFPYAGGGPAAFHKWLSGLPDSIEARIAHYPGRGSRHAEAPVKQIGTLAEHLLLAMQPLLDKPFALFGHSLGALVAFELAHRLRRNGLLQPQILFVSACGAPHLSDPHPPIHSLPAGDFIGALQQLNGIPSELLHQPEAMQLLLPIVRADFEAIENHVHSPKELPLDFPIVAFGGLDDPRVRPEHMEGWSLHTSAEFHSQYYPGDHFFIHTAGEVVIAALAATLRSIYAKN